MTEGRSADSQRHSRLAAYSADRHDKRHGIARGSTVENSNTYSYQARDRSWRAIHGQQRRVHSADGNRDRRLRPRKRGLRDLAIDPWRIRFSRAGCIQDNS
jgi:hypothetical protein